MQLTDTQWKEIKRFVLNHPKNSDRRGRPSLDEREVMNAILWVLGSGARWKQMPDAYPQYQTCRNYFYSWLKKGAIEDILTVLADGLMPEEKIVFERTKGKAYNPCKKKLSEIVQKIQEAT